jgi:hypothetical protein
VTVPPEEFDGGAEEDVPTPALLDPGALRAASTERHEDAVAVLSEWMAEAAGIPDMGEAYRWGARELMDRWRRDQKPR